MRRIITVLIASSLISIFAAPTPATALESGQSCSKQNQVRKVKFSGETYTYRCVKNPLYKKTRLTWTLDECILAIRAYNGLADKSSLVATTTKDLRDISCQAGI
jgi:hypothetical protein